MDEDTLRALKPRGYDGPHGVRRGFAARPRESGPPPRISGEPTPPQSPPPTPRAYAKGRARPVNEKDAITTTVAHRADKILSFHVIVRSIERLQRQIHEDLQVRFQLPVPDRAVHALQRISQLSNSLQNHVGNLYPIMETYQTCYKLRCPGAEDLYLHHELVEWMERLQACYVELRHVLVQFSGSHMGRTRCIRLFDEPSTGSSVAGYLGVLAAEMSNLDFFVAANMAQLEKYHAHLWTKFAHPLLASRAEPGIRHISVIADYRRVMDTGTVVTALQTCITKTLELFTMLRGWRLEERVLDRIDAIVTLLENLRLILGLVRDHKFSAYVCLDSAELSFEWNRHLPRMTISYKDYTTLDADFLERVLYRIDGFRLQFTRDEDGPPSSSRKRAALVDHQLAILRKETVTMRLQDILGDLERLFAPAIPPVKADARGLSRPLWFYTQ